MFASGKGSLSGCTCPDLVPLARDGPVPALEMEMYLWCACVCCGVGCVCVCVCGVLWCGVFVVVEGVACLLLSGGLSSEQTLGHHLATSQRAMVTPAVCPRLFEFLTTLTFRAMGRNHIGSTPHETIAKKKRQRKLVVHMRSAIYHELSRTQPKSEGKSVSVSVDALAAVW